MQNPTVKQEDRFDMEASTPLQNYNGWRLLLMTKN